MNHAILITLALAFCATNSMAQERIYRCGNEYTNTLTGRQAKDCKLVEGGNVTVIQGTKPAPAAKSTPSISSAAAPANSPRVDSSEQKFRDSDARLILESELKKAEARQAELSKEYKNGEPDQQGGEARNHQKYINRVAELKASLSRIESDIAGIRRELGRVSNGSGAK
ncbi:hypothetical protein [Rhodoferax sp. PAMC 29310]|uniref:hypothetical protein n=1 Tax=Rhodoferax sp. PAMC 29310 TaxID=2822760 RepID=UPI001B31E1D9|nr:hypothetical protein [Rhodoferax sp. PAMC 29310]